MAAAAAANLIAAVLAMFITLGHGQWLTTSSGTSERTCPLTEFRARLRDLDSVCPHGNGDGVAPSGCSPMCAAILADLERDCDLTMRGVFDAVDGNDDDNPEAVSDFRALCDTVTVPDIFREMGRIVDAGNCGTFDPEGVGEQTVVDPSAGGGCVDTGPASRCALVRNGILTCAEDFCSDCSHAGDCDRTCAFCGNNQQHRRVLSQRGLQIDLSKGCLPSNLETRVAPMNHACCDADRMTACDGGSAGVPTVCDARCGIAFTPFFDDCEMVRSSFAPDPSTMSAFVDLDRTCRGLPRQQLLSSLADALPCEIGDASNPNGGKEQGIFGAWMDSAMDCRLEVFEAKIGEAGKT